MAQSTMDGVLNQGTYSLTLKTMPATSSETVNLPLTCELLSNLTPNTTYALTISQPITIAKWTVMSAAMTLNLTITSGIQKGALLYGYFLSDGTARHVTGGTGTDTLVAAGTLSKAIWCTWVYDGTTFDLVNVYTTT
jgi:hypothetical protein